MHLLTFLPFIITTVYALGKLEPADGKLLFGAWIDTSSEPQSGGDSPFAFNSRIGFRASAFQYYQHLPLKPPAAGAPDYDLPNHNLDGTLKLSVLNDSTNAAIFLTIYPMQGITEAAVSDDQIVALANQVNGITKSTGRNLFLRLAPEMNGDWFIYGEQPTAFITFWRRFHNLFTPIAPQVALVWSPNFRAATERFPYDPYWPGTEYVDWVGISIYWKGLAKSHPWLENTLAPSDYAAQLLDAAGPEGSVQSFYQDYGVRYNKPVVISESAAAFHMASKGRPLDAGVGQTATVMSFWNSFIFNPAFRSKYPLLKMVFCFEMVKTEDEETTNDYRATVDPGTLVEFKKGIAAMDRAGVVVWARESGVSVSSSATAVVRTATATSLVVATEVVAATKVASEAVSTQQRSGGAAIGSVWSLVLVVVVGFMAL
ncbi:glycoside hydrolase superfamily [Chytriomyces cf. hyalinus JEL632]|nr:glycoside hydrolase superfamily [Chytriomyces cf. hyalinus JEL632]